MNRKCPGWVKNKARKEAYVCLYSATAARQTPARTFFATPWSLVTNGVIWYPTHAFRSEGSER